MKCCTASFLNTQQFCSLLFFINTRCIVMIRWTMYRTCAVVFKIVIVHIVFNQLFTDVNKWIIIFRKYCTILVTVRKGSARPSCIARLIAIIQYQVPNVPLNKSFVKVENQTPTLFYYCRFCLKICFENIENRGFNYGTHCTTHTERIF